VTDRPKVAITVGSTQVTLAPVPAERDIYERRDGLPGRCRSLAAGVADAKRRIEPSGLQDQAGA